MNAGKGASPSMEFIKVALAELISTQNPLACENQNSSEPKTEETDTESTEGDEIIVVDDEPSSDIDLTKDFLVIADYPPPCAPQVYSQQLLPSIAEVASYSLVINQDFLFPTFEYEKPLMDFGVDSMVYNQSLSSSARQPFRPWLEEENNISSLYDNNSSIQWYHQSKAASYHSRYGYHYLDRIRPYSTFGENTSTVPHHFVEDPGTMDAMNQLVALSFELRLRNDAMFGPH